MNIVTQDISARPNVPANMFAATTRAKRRGSASRPIISLSTLVKAIVGAPASELLPLVRGSDGSRLYQTAICQAVDWMTEGVPFDVSAPTRAHEKAAIWALMTAPPRPPRWSRALRGKSRPARDVGDFMVSVKPDVEIDGGRERGAAMIHLAKKPLSEAAGATMASLLFYFLSEEDHAIARSHCLVYDPRAQREFRASEGPRNVERQLPAALAVLSGLWRLACADTGDSLAYAEALEEE